MKKTLIPILLLVMALAMINGKTKDLTSNLSASPEKNSEDSPIVCGDGRSASAVATEAGKPGCGGNRSTYLLKSKKNK